jgi:hypothetical protein
VAEQRLGYPQRVIAQGARTRGQGTTPARANSCSAGMGGGARVPSPGMQPDVSETLSELERKLKELEYELEAVGRGSEQPPAPTTPSVWPGHPDPEPWSPGPPVASWSGAETPPAPLPPASPLDEVLRLREQLLRTADELVAQVERIVRGAAPAAPAYAPAPSAYTAPAPPPPPPDPAATILAGRVTLDAGPFSDVATLGAFEQALQRTAGVLDVYVRALDAGRATIDVELSGPVALGTELRRTSPVAFQVLDVGQGRLELSIDAT